MYDRQLEAEALMHEIQEQATCPSCRRKVEQDFIVCPYCRATLRTACEDCGKPMASTWVLCPYCGAERTLPAASSSPGRPAPPQQPEPISARPKRASTATYTPPAASKSPADPAPDAGS